MNRPSRPQDIVFFGATTASVSHELKNVATIINETAGLLHDLTLGADRGRPLDTLRVRKIATDLSNHVGRAVEILNRLNRFAHTTDEPWHSFDLARLLRDVVALAERPASLRGITLEARLPEGPVWVESDAFGLHQLLTHALRVGFLGQASTTNVTIALAPPVAASPDGAQSATTAPAFEATVRVEPVPVVPADAAAESFAELCGLGATLGVSAAITPVDGALADLQIRVPAHSPRSRGATGADAGS